MRTNRDQRPLSYPLRLPDELQADALRLLDLSREVVNAVVTSLWDRLDDFGERTNKYAYKQVEEMTSSPQLHGDRQWRCEAEQAGRILRGQAERKKQFALILPLAWWARKHPHPPGEVALSRLVQKRQRSFVRRAVLALDTLTGSSVVLNVLVVPIAAMLWSRHAITI